MLQRSVTAIQIPPYAMPPRSFAMRVSLDGTKRSLAEAVAIGLIVSGLIGTPAVRRFNSFIVTAGCEVDDFCYIEALRVQEYLNSKVIWDALSPPKQVNEFKLEAQSVVTAFAQGSDQMTATSSLVEFLLANQVHVMNYQGNLDLACNTAGNLKWAHGLPWKGQVEFTSKPLQQWSSVVAATGRNETVGTMKEVEVQMSDVTKGTSRYAFVTVDGAGHLVSHSLLLEVHMVKLT